MNRKVLIILFTVILPWLTCNSQSLHGRVTDDSSQPLPGASVYIAGLRQGTTTNQNGFYDISLPAGTFSVSYQFLGYAPVTRTITVDTTDIVADVTLSEQIFEIPAVRVSASGKDPAWFIMRKAIGMAPFHLNQIRMYKAEVYIRGGGRIDRLPKIIKRQMKAEVNDNQLVEGKYYFSESVNLITFNAPDRYVHEVISSRSNMKLSEEQISPMDYVEASFYQPVLADIAISPLAPNAFSHYIFRFLGSTSQGDYVIDKIEVTPRRKSQQLFAGVIYIVEDLWAIHSLDLTNENMVGRIRVRQLYAPVEEGIWMPINHVFEVDLSVIGIKAVASYTSAVRYLEVEPDSSLSLSAGYLTTPGQTVATEAGNDTQKKIETILAKDELTVRDMSRLVRLNEKNAGHDEDKSSLEIKDKTTYIIDEGAFLRDSAYWEEVRPIPLTKEEEATIDYVTNASLALTRRDTTTLTISVDARSGSGSNRPATAFLKDIATGRRWQLSKNTYLGFDGLIHLRSFSFNTIDGFIAGTGINLVTEWGEARRLSLYPSARYAFGREKLMWTVTANILYDPMRSGNFFIRAGSHSDEFSASGVNPLINTISSLFFRENWMKLYSSTYVIAGNTIDLANGLNLSLTAMYEHRDPLENTTSFSVFKPERLYSLNVPENPFVAGEVDEYAPLVSFSHSHISFTSALTYTPRQRYRLSDGMKISAGSDYPTFSLSWKHGFNFNDTLSGHFDMIMAEINRTKSYGALNEFRWRIRGGGFINRHNVQLQDMYFFNTQASPVLVNNFEDAFYLKPYYSISSPSFFAEGHARYTSPTLLLKRLPGLCRTLIREHIGLAALWAPDYGCYFEAGYTMSEIFFIAEAGIYAGFRNLSPDALSLRLTLRIR
jgi:hypothetical protein